MALFLSCRCEADFTPLLAPSIGPVVHVLTSVYRLPGITLAGHNPHTVILGLKLYNENGQMNKQVLLRH